MIYIYIIIVAGENCGSVIGRNVATLCSRTNSGDPANYVLGQTQGVVQLIIRHVSFNRLETRTGVHIALVIHLGLPLDL